MAHKLFMPGAPIGARGQKKLKKCCLKLFRVVESCLKSLISARDLHTPGVLPIQNRDCIAGFQIGGVPELRARQMRELPAGLETRDTADLEVCATRFFAAYGSMIHRHALILAHFQKGKKPTVGFLGAFLKDFCRGKPYMAKSEFGVFREKQV